MQEITPLELKELIDRKTDFQLIDVREPHEVEIATIGGENIPMGDVMDSLDKIDKNKKVVIYCRSGNRSGAIINALINEGFTNLYNLTGGILAYSDDVDDSLMKY
ncbi:MAG: rhodanese-like domain-containing protein [Bacteroidetes bacterium]|nr:rhodanese-like domain-containing protein [Bacteroidota bacterium]